MAGLSGAGVFVNTLPLHPVDIFIFVAFLAITLIVGIVTGGRSKTIQDYALGGKNFSTLSLTATIIATWYGGGAFYYGLGSIYSHGFYRFISFLGTPLCLLIIGQMVSVRMGKFLHNVSVAEAMGEMYGKRVQLISAISSIAGRVGYLAVQFQVISRILGLFLGTQQETLLIVTAAIVMLYSTMGGIRAVTFTDVVQFFTFGTFLPMLALIVWNSLKDPNQLVEVFTHNPNFNLGKVVGWNAGFINTLAIMFFFTIPAFDPPAFQRVLMARSTQQVRSAFTYSAIIALFIEICIAWVAVLLLADNPNLDPGKLVNYLIDKYTYWGLKGMLVSGIVALAMSSADSYINTAAVLFSNDIVKPLGLKKHNSVLVARLFSLVVGILGLLLSLRGSDLLSLILLSGSMYMPIVGVPLLLAIFGFRTSKRSVLIGMAAGLSIVLLWRKFLAHTGIESVMPATLGGFIFLMGSHYLLGEPGGWEKVAPDSPLGLARAARKEAREKRINAIKNFKLYPYLQKSLPYQEGLYTLFGFYTIAATYTGFYTIGDSNIQSYREIYEGIYHTVLFATTAFLTFPIWPPTVKSYRFMAFFWPLGMGAILFFAGTLLMVISQFHTMQVMVLIINLMIAVLLLPSSLAIVLAFSGISLAILFFQYYTGQSLLWDMAASFQFNLLYGLLLATSVLIVLFGGKKAYAQLGKKNAVLQHRDKDRQASLIQVSAEKQAALAALQYAGVEELLTITRELETMHVAEEEKERMKALQTKLLPIAFHLQGLNTRAQDYLRLEKAYLTLEGWCDEIKAAVVEQGITARIYCNNKSECEQIQCDPQGLTSLVVHSMVLLNTQLEVLEDTPPILFRVEDTCLSYPLGDVRKGYIKYVPAVRIAITISDDLPEVQESYSAELNGSSQPPTPKTVEELARHANSRIVKSHYGYEEVTDDTLIYVVPVDVEDVRPKDMDQDYMEVGAMPKRANDHFKNEKDGIDAQAQEAAFLADVAARSDANMDMVQTALETIKWYHGPKNRNSGEPFYLHPLTVAHIVLDYNTDEETIIGALLHDTVEDTAMQLEQIEDRFGKATAEVVNVVTHLQSVPHSIYKVKMSASENLQMLERTGNKKGLYVKIADRMHNMRTINGHKKVAKRKLIAQETAEFFIPLTQKLGLKKATREFEKMCLEVLKQQG